MVILASSFCKPKSSFKPTVIQQVLEYREKCVKKFQKIPIIEFSSSLINLINLVYRDFPGKMPVFKFFWEIRENPDIRG